jgi:hypothetical protein
MTIFKLHRVFKGKDEVLGMFKIVNDEICFPTSADEHNCDMFPSGPMSEYTKNRITHLLDNKSKSMYLEKIK